eukprot:gb/GECH01002403.1/.p1 GENE.gb/GECH01002403.1/~~gb/GECH01002403.1/.p1  ORF type:complete len:308 (+),score=62.45 gb/GECH01002403.1/:1-924(+)
MKNIYKIYIHQSFSNTLKIIKKNTRGEQKNNDEEEQESIIEYYYNTCDITQIQRLTRVTDDNTTYDLEIYVHPGVYDLSQYGFLFDDKTSTLCNKFLLQGLSSWKDTRIITDSARTIDISCNINVILNNIAVYQSRGNHYTMFFRNCNVSISNSYIASKSQSSIVLDDSVNLRLYNSIIEKGRWSCIRIEQAKNISIRHCSIGNNQNSGIDLQNITMEHLDIRFNQIHSNDHFGLSTQLYNLSPETEDLISNGITQNWIYDNEKSDVQSILKPELEAQNFIGLRPLELFTLELYKIFDQPLFENLHK